VSGAVVLALVAAMSALGYVAYGSDLHLPGAGDGAGAAPGAPAATPSPGRAGARSGSESADRSGVRAAAQPVGLPEVAATAEPVRLEPRPLLVPGDSGDRVRELQSRLDQLDWYHPDISGDYDRATRAAVRGFQAKRGFEVTGKVFPRTWHRLVRMTRMPTYNEMHNIMVPGPTIIGPGDEGRDVRELQARLKQIGWFFGDVTPDYGDQTEEAVSGFQTKREIPSTGEVDQRTWNRLVAMTYDPSEAELFNREPAPSEGAPLDPRCLQGEALCIDKTTSSLRYVVDGDVRMEMDVRFGDESTPTREGEFEVEWKDADHVSTLYHTEMPYSMFFSGGQAVHYSSDFATYGYSGASHGCVNVRDYDAIAQLYDLIDVGDTVVVYWS
jgi:peptidoglycan hydrolase-like protein with peptidoglycan-binding domain